MSSLAFAEVCRFLQSIQVPHHVMGTPETGRALVVEEGARVLAMAPPGSDLNVLWTHPDLRQCSTRKELSTVGAGGMGGIRLWQAPEAAYHWNGPAEPKTFSNYQLQEAMDPGAYTLRELSANRCTVEGSVTLIDYGNGSRVAFDIRTTIELAPLPDLYAACGAGLRIRWKNHLFLREGNEASRVDLWHLMQLPTPSPVGARVRPDLCPEIYFNPEWCEGWQIKEECFTWQTNGKRTTKVGLASGGILGGPFAIRNHGAELGIYLWNIPIHPDREYVDAPPGRTARDQIIQFWNGFGFCEVEYHSPAASLQQPEISDISEITYLEILPENFGLLRKIVTLPSLPT